MNSNWTGRAPRTMGECHFRDDCEAIEHYRTGDGWTAWIPVALVIVLAILGTIHLVARL